MTWSLSKARPADAPALTAIAMSSKASWGYPQEFMDACRRELTITAARIARESMTVAVGEDDEILGFVAVTTDREVADLADLFVVPDGQGGGVGRALFEAACEAARVAGCGTLTIEADPHAVEWYERRGAVLVGEAPSKSIPGRMLPVLEFVLGEAPRSGRTS